MIAYKVTCLARVLKESYEIVPLIISHFNIFSDAHKNIGCVNGQKHNSEFLPWLAGGFWITQITQECITRGWIPLEWVTFYMRSDCKTKNCIHHDTSSYQKVGVKFSAGFFFGHFRKNSARRKLEKFQNSANFFSKTQEFS